MLNFFRKLQDYSLFIHYLSIVVVVAGIVALLNFRKEARPNVNFNRVAVSASWIGASPEDVEQLVIDPIEEKIAEVEGIDEYRSIAFAGAASLSITIDENHPEPTEVVDEIRRKILEVRNLPEDVETPTVIEIKASNRPILKMALIGNLPPLKKKIEVDRLKDFLKTKKGVQSIESEGLNDLQLKVYADAQSLQKLDINLLEFAEILKKWTRQHSGGQLETREKETHLSVGYNRNNIDEIKKLPIRANSFGRSVKVGDVAKLSIEAEENAKETIFETAAATLITVYKKPLSDAVSTVDLINKKLKNYQQQLPKELTLKVYNDQSKRIRSRLNMVGVNAVFGLILVIIILLLFLNFRSAVVTSLGIPIAVLGGLIVLLLLGQTLNSLLVIGLIIVMGMLVDDAIVVCENIYAKLEQGLSPKEAAIQGVTQITIPVITTVLTTVFAFLPIAYMSGIMGQFLKVIPIAVIAMLSFSLFEALIILPIHAAEILKISSKRKSPFLITLLQTKYRKYLRWSIRNKYIVTFIFLVFCAFSMWQGKNAFKKFTLFPAVGIESVDIGLELPHNTIKAKTRRACLELNKELRAELGSDIESNIAVVGELKIGGSRGSRRSGSNMATLTVVFTEDPSLYLREKTLIKNIRAIVKKIGDKHQATTSLTLDRPGPPSGKPIQIQVTARDFELGKKVVTKIAEAFAQIEGVNDLETDLDGNRIKYRFLIQEEKAISMGVNPEIIAQTIFLASSGRTIETVLNGNEKLELHLSLNKSDLKNVQSVMNLSVRNKFGQSIKLGQLLKLKTEQSPSNIQRINGSRTITLFGEVNENKITGKEANLKVQPLLQKLKKENPSLRLESGGREKNRRKSLADTKKLFIFSLLMIFMIISLCFQSVWIPFYVLLSIPLGISGVAWALFVHGQSLSMMGIIGIIGLSGVVVNVSIILMTFIVEKLKTGMSLDEAVVAASVERLRAIVVTTLTTLIGLLPTIYGIGGTDTFVQPLAMALGWGLAVASLLTLLFLPAIVSLTWVSGVKK